MILDACCGVRMMWLELALLALVFLIIRTCYIMTRDIDDR